MLHYLIFDVACYYCSFDGTFVFIVAAAEFLDLGGADGFYDGRTGGFLHAG